MFAQNSKFKIQRSKKYYFRLVSSNLTAKRERRKDFLRTYVMGLGI
jgi:hypothetical protein